MSLFGTTQVLRMICKVVAVKCASVFLGPVGIGIIGLVENTLGLITQGSSFGMSVIGTKAIAQNKDDASKTAQIAKLQLIWMVAAGVLAALISIIFAEKLSMLTFGDDSYTKYFRLLSLYFIFQAIVNAATVIMQGLNEIKKLINYQLMSLGFITLSTISCYYFLGIEGIVPSFLLSSFISLVVHLSFLRKLGLSNVKLSKEQISDYGKKLISSGILLALNGVFGLVCFYILRQYLLYTSDDIAILGYYETANIYLLSYFGVIFTSLAADFFPRLSSKMAVSEDVNELVNAQIQLGLLVATPLVLIMYCMAPYIIILLSSAAFLPVQEILLFGLLSIICKTINYPMGYMVLGKGDTRHYFIQNIVSDALILGFTYFLFKEFQLIGIGMAVFLQYMFFSFYIYYFVKKKYGFVLDKASKTIIVISVLFTFSVVICQFTENAVSKVLQYIVAAMGIIHCLHRLIKVTNVLHWIKKSKGE